MSTHRSGEAIRKLAKTLADRGAMIASRIGDDGEIRGRQGLAADIRWARELLDEIERDTLGTVSSHEAYCCGRGDENHFPGCKLLGELRALRARVASGGGT